MSEMVTVEGRDLNVLSVLPERRVHHLSLSIRRLVVRVDLRRLGVRVARSLKAAFAPRSCAARDAVRRCA
jgi:hypothetical protein